MIANDGSNWIEDVGTLKQRAGPKIDGLVLKFFDGHFLKMYVI